MRRVFNFRSAGLTVFLAIVVLSAICVRHVDVSREPVETALSATLNVAEAVGKEIALAKALPLDAGWAKREITPGFRVPLAGYGVRRGALSQGVESPLWCKALALRTGDKTLVLVSLDLLLIPENFGRMLRQDFHEKTGLPAEALFLTCTHTHSAPNPWDSRVASILLGGGYRKEFGDLLKRSVMDSVREAMDRLGPAELAVGRTWVSELIRNRNGDAPLDAWLEWIAVRKSGGKGVCLVGNYGAHPTVLGHSNMRIDGDYPGYFTRALELRENIDMAMFQAGAVGGACPRPSGAALKIDDFTAARQMGFSLAEKIGNLSRGLSWHRRLELDSRIMEIALPPVQIRIAGSDWVFSPPVARMTGLGRKAPLQVARVGNSLLLGLPVEFNTEISRELKAELRERYGINLWITSDATGFYGYLTPDALYGKRDERGRYYYESSEMSFLGPHAEYYFRRLLEILGESVAGENLLQ